MSKKISHKIATNNSNSKNHVISSPTSASISPSAAPFLPILLPPTSASSSRPTTVSDDSSLQQDSILIKQLARELAMQMADEFGFFNHNNNNYNYNNNNHVDHSMRLKYKNSGKRVPPLSNNKRPLLTLPEWDQSTAIAAPKLANPMLIDPQAQQMMMHPFKKIGIFSIDVDEVTQQGGLTRLKAGEFYSLGLSIGYGPSVNYTKREYEDKEFVDVWQKLQGGFHALLVYSDLSFPQRECAVRRVSYCSFVINFEAECVGNHKLFVNLGGRPIPGSPFDVIIRAADPKARQSEAVGLGLWTAQVGMESNFQIKVRDLYGNPLDRGGFDCTVEVKGPEDLQVAIKDCADGSYLASYTPRCSGRFEVTIKISGEKLPGCPYLVTVSGGGLDPSKTKVFTDLFDKMQGVVGTETWIRVETFDAFDNGLCRGGDSVTVELIGPVEETVSVADMLDGTYTAMFVSRWSGMYDLMIKANGVTIPGSPFKVRMLSGVTFPPNCDCSLTKNAESRLITKVGIDASFEVYTKDKFGNTCDEQSAEDAFDVVIRGPAHYTAKVNYIGSGTYKVSFIAWVSGEYFVSIRRAEFEIIGSPFMITIDPGSTVAANSVASGEGLEKAVAGETAVFRIQAADEWNNHVQLPGDDFQAWLEGPVQRPVHIVDEGDGTYTGSYSTTVRGQYELFVSLGTPGPTTSVGKSPFVVFVIANKTDARQSFAQGSGVTVARAGDVAEYKIHACDAYGNRTAIGGDPFEVYLVGVDGKDKVIGELEDLQDGTYIARYTAFVSKSYMLVTKLHGAHIIDSPLSIFVHCARVFPARCYTVGDTVRGGTAGVEYEFIIQGVDPYGNLATTGGEKFEAYMEGAAVVQMGIKDLNDGRYLVTYNAFWAGDYNIQCLCNGEHIQGSPFEAKIVPNVMHPPSCYVAGLGAVIAGEPISFSVQIKDEFLNSIPEQVPLFVQMRGPTIIVPRQTYQHPGSFKCECECTAMGKYEVEISVNGVHISDSPYEVVVNPSRTNADTCVASGPGLINCVAGKVADITIFANDEFGNRQARGDEAFSITVDGPSLAQVSIDDNDDGSYGATYVVTIAGSYLIHVKYQHNEIGGSPYIATCIAGDADADNSIISGRGIRACNVDKTAEFRLQTVDKYGNYLRVGGTNLTADIKIKQRPGEVVDEEPVVAIEDNSDGTYTGTYVIDRVCRYNLYVALQGKPLPGTPFDCLCIALFEYKWDDSKSVLENMRMQQHWDPTLTPEENEARIAEIFGNQDDSGDDSDSDKSDSDVKLTEGKKYNVNEVLGDNKMDKVSEQIKLVGKGLKTVMGLVVFGREDPKEKEELFINAKGVAASTEKTSNLDKGVNMLAGLVSKKKK